jgi:hypothetical protein
VSFRVRRIAAQLAKPLPVEGACGDLICKEQCSRQAMLALPAALPASWFSLFAFHEVTICYNKQQHIGVQCLQAYCVWQGESTLLQVLQLLPQLLA